MDREEFLEKLMIYNIDEIREIINSNGKGPKVIELICRISDEE